MDFGTAAEYGGQYCTRDGTSPRNVITLSLRGSPSASPGAHCDAMPSSPAASISLTVYT